MPLLVKNPKYKAEEDVLGIKTLYYLPGKFMVCWWFGVSFNEENR